MSISLSESIWFFDVDDTLINTGATSYMASEGIRRVMESNYGPEKAKKVQDTFNNLFRTMMENHQSKVSDEAEEIRRDILAYQEEIQKESGSVKMWSREIFTKIAADRSDVIVTPELLSEAVDAYFLDLTNNVIVLPGVLDLFGKIKQAGRPIFLVTGSDARLTLKENGQFAYDPKSSEALKRERLAPLREKGIEYNALSIGDPEDKPHKDFFDKAVRTAEDALGELVELSKSIMVGDSYTADLKTPKEQMGFGLVVTFEKERIKPEVVDEHQLTVGNLTDILNYVV